MIYRFALASMLALLIASGTLVGDAPLSESVRIPDELKVKAGRILLIKAVTDAKDILWISYSDDADLLPYLDNQGLFVASNSGVYKVAAVVVSGGKPVISNYCLVTVGAPVPPVPPEDPLTTAFKAAFKNEPDTAKVSRTAALAALYRNASVVMVNDMTIQSWGDLQNALIKARKAAMPDSALMSMRTAVQAELASNFPNNPAVAIDRVLAQKVIAHIATSLEAVK